MTTEPSPVYVQRELQSADEALSDAVYLLQAGRLRAAANRAYYAMFHAVQARSCWAAATPDERSRPAFLL